MALDYRKCAEEIFSYLGGKDNIISAAHCATRLRLVIADNSKTIIECNVIVLYGSNVVELAANIQEAVISAVRPMVGISDVTVNVNICGIVRK